MLVLSVVYDSNLQANCMVAALQGQRAQRIEMLLLHEFHGRKFLLPDKLTFREREALARRDAEDAGEDAPAEAAGAGALPTRCAYFECVCLYSLCLSCGPAGTIYTTGHKELRRTRNPIRSQSESNLASTGTCGCSCVSRHSRMGPKL